MGFHWNIFARPSAHATVRYVAATKQESAEAAAKREARTAGYRAKVEALAPEQRRAAYALGCTRSDVAAASVRQRGRVG